VKGRDFIRASVAQPLLRAVVAPQMQQTQQMQQMQQMQQKGLLADDH
jgi:hypothetical protein